jgi:sporulation protein YlmC with PRC-barrel domain
LRRTLGFLACLAALGFSTQLMAEEPPAGTTQEPNVQEQIQQEQKAQKQAEQGKDGERVMAAKTFRSSQLSGMEVRNSKGEDIGTIDDLVIDLRTGKVQYAAMSVGGVLGVGDRLYAVPFNELKFEHGQDDKFFVIDIDPKKIASVPGFDKHHWPEAAEPNFVARIEQHYRKAEVRTGEKRSDDRPRTEPKNDRND